MIKNDNRMTTMTNKLNTKRNNQQSIKMEKNIYIGQTINPLNTYPVVKSQKDTAKYNP